MSDSEEIIPLIEVFKRHSDEADELVRRLDELLDGHNSVACTMAMGAVIGAQCCGDDDIAAERAAIVMASIMMQISSHKELRNTLN